MRSYFAAAFVLLLVPPLVAADEKKETPPAPAEAAPNEAPAGSAAGRIHGSETPAIEKPITATPGAGYLISTRDLVKISVYGEPDVNIERRIGGEGRVSVPLLGMTELRGLSVDGAEEKIRKLYIERGIYIDPQVSVAIMEYFPKEVSVIGQVKTPGKVIFPIEANSLSIIDVISKVGGITRIGKSSTVRVTRKGADELEQTFIVNIEPMFDGRGGVQPFPVLPGDVIYVPERIF